MNKTRLSVVNFIKRNDQSHLTMESFTIELASNASAQLFRDNTLNFFANVISELLNLEGQWDDAISEVSYPSMYQNVRDGFFSNKKLSKLSEYYHPEPVLYPSVTNFAEALKFSIKKGTTTGKLYRSESVSKNAKKMRFTLQLEDLVLHSLARKQDTISEVKLVMNVK